MTLLFIVIATVVVSLVSLIGLLLIGLHLNIKKITFYLISLASGTMLGGAFLHLIPESLAFNAPHIFTTIAIGVFLFFIFEKLLIWRHCHHHDHPTDYTRPTAAMMMMTGDTIHNFIDGIIIAAAFMANTNLGISVTLAIMLHEIPQELGDFGVLMHAGFSLKQAVTYNFLTSLASILGALLAYFFLNSMPLLQPYLIAITAGGFLYIALADLIPQLHEQVDLRHTLMQIALLLGGFFAMFSLRSHAI